MNFFDSINHAMTTMSTGGFSTKNASIAHFTSLWVQYPILIFMFVGGMNYTIIYLLFKGRSRHFMCWSQGQAHLSNITRINAEKVSV